MYKIQSILGERSCIAVYGTWLGGVSSQMLSFCLNHGAMMDNFSFCLVAGHSLELPSQFSESLEN